jgi:hypothetical protein
LSTSATTALQQAASAASASDGPADPASACRPRSRKPKTSAWRGGKADRGASVMAASSAR